MKSPSSIALFEFSFIMEQSIHMLYCLTHPNTINNILRDINPNDNYTEANCSVASLDQESWLDMSIKIKFDKFFSGNARLYETIHKDALTKLFGGYLIVRPKGSGRNISYEWEMNSEIWKDNDIDVSINANESQKSLGNIYSYKIFETILSNDNLVETLSEKVINTIPLDNIENLLIGYEGLEWELDAINKTNLTNIKYVEWNIMLRKYYYRSLKEFRKVLSSKNSSGISQIDSIFLLDILLEHANLTLCNSNEKQAMIASMLKTTVGNVQNTMSRLKNEDKTAHESRLKTVAKIFNEQKLDAPLQELYTHSSYYLKKE